jgi:hypothetical protein
MREQDHTFLKNGRDLFLRKVLEDVDHIGSLHEISFSARLHLRVQRSRREGI